MLKKKITKILLILGSLILIVILLFDYLIYPMLSFWEDEATTTMYVNATVTQTLQIPHQSDRVANRPYIYKEEWQDLEPISKEEWFNMKCAHPETPSGKYFTSPWAKQVLTNEGQKRVHCVMPVFWGEKYPYVNKMPRHCTSIFNCSAIDVTFYDYILEYPKVLNNVIKIMEKPCKYLYDDFSVPTTIYYEPSKEEKEHLIKEDKYILYNTVTRIKNYLYCNAPRTRSYEKDRTYSVIYILDKDGNKKTEIIVPRKDNAHLIKDSKR